MAFKVTTARKNLKFSKLVIAQIDKKFKICFYSKILINIKSN